MANCACLVIAAAFALEPEGEGEWVLARIESKKELFPLFLTAASTRDGKAESLELRLKEDTAVRRDEKKVSQDTLEEGQWIEFKGERSKDGEQIVITPQVIRILRAKRTSGSILSVGPEKEGRCTIRVKRDKQPEEPLELQLTPATEVREMRRGRTGEISIRTLKISDLAKGQKVEVETTRGRGDKADKTVTLSVMIRR